MFGMITSIAGTTSNIMVLVENKLFPYHVISVITSLICVSRRVLLIL